MKKQLIFRSSVLVLFALSLWGSPTIAAQQSCAAVGDGCEATCEDWCRTQTGNPVYFEAGCGCPTVGTYGSSCDCQCLVGPLWTAINPLPEDPPCPLWDQVEETCEYCPHGGCCD